MPQLRGHGLSQREKELEVALKEAALGLTLAAGVAPTKENKVAILAMADDAREVLGHEVEGAVDLSDHYYARPKTFHFILEGLIGLGKMLGRKK